MSSPPLPDRYLWMFGGRIALGEVPITSCWYLDEAAGTRVDSVAGHDLAPTNAPVGAAGVFGNGCLFDTNQYLSVAHHADLQGGDVDLSIAAYVRVDHVNIDQMMVLGKYGAGGLEYELLVTGFGSYTNHLQFWWVEADGVTNSAAYGPEIVEGQTYFVVAWRDKAAGTVNLQVDHGPIYTSGPVSTGGNVTAGAFTIGARNTPAKYFDGLADEVYLYRGLWTDEQKLNLDARSALEIPVYAYATDGAKVASLTVTDACGRVATDTVAVTVT